MGSDMNNLNDTIFPGNFSGSPRGGSGGFEFETRITEFKSVFYPCIATFGTIGNITAFFVFVKTRLRKISSAYYLAAIAVCDTGWLWTTFISNLSLFDIQFYNQQAACQATTFFNLVFTFLSIWYLVSLVTEKFIALYWPLVRTRMCTTFRAKLVIIFLGVFSVVVYNYVTYVYGPEMTYGIPRCNIWRFQYEHYKNLDKLDAVVVSIVPHLSIIIMCLLIAIRAKHYYNVSKTLERPAVRRHPPETKPLKVTRILLPMTVVVLLLHLASSYARASRIFGAAQMMNADFRKFQEMAQLISSLSYAIKCLVYVISSRSFRRETQEMFAKLLFKIIRRNVIEKSNSIDSQKIPMAGVEIENAKQPLKLQQSSTA